MHGIAVRKAFERGRIRPVVFISGNLFKFRRHRRPIVVQQSVLAQQFVHIGLCLRRVLQQQREIVFLFVLMVQRRSDVEILANLPHGLQHDVVAAVFGDIAVQHADLFAKTAYFAVAGVQHFYRFGKSNATRIK